MKFRRPSFCSCVAALLVLLSCCVACAQPSTQPASDLTQDLLNQIDSAAPPKNTPASPTPRASADSSSAAFGWFRLMHLFLPSLLAAAALGIAASMTGVFVLLRREALVALAMPQIVAVGAAIGMRLELGNFMHRLIPHVDVPPTLPTALLTAAAALVYLVLSRRRGAGYWVLPSLYIAGLSISFLIIANHGQDVADLQNLFVGVDVAVTPETALFVCPILLVSGAACALLWRRWLLMAQAPSAAELAGLRPARWDALFLTLLTLILLLGTDALGVIMALAMLFLPAAAVLPWAKRIPSALGWSALLSVIFLAVGFYLSNTMSWPMSQSIGGVGFAAVVASHLIYSWPTR